MKHIFYSDGAIYQLRRLSQTVQEETGIRHRLSDPASVLALLRFSSASPVERIYNDFSSFVVELDSEQQAYLRSEGLVLSSATQEKINAIAQN